MNDPNIPTNTKLARREWKGHQRRAWFLFVVLAVVCVILTGFGVRVLKFQAMLGILASAAALQFIIFMNAQRLVLWLMKCTEPESSVRDRLAQIIDRLLPKSGLHCRPMLYVSHSMEAPNAFAFGTGINGAYGVAVTPEILELLDDHELTAVLAHELGHLRAHDTALMTLVSVTLAFIGKIASHFRHIGRAALIIAVAMEIIIYLPSLVAAGISQLREFAADAFSAMVTGSPTPLIRAFDKFEQWHREHPEPSLKKLLLRPSMDELRLSHPHMNIRKQFLRDLAQKEV